MSAAAVSEMHSAAPHDFSPHCQDIDLVHNTRPRRRSGRRSRNDMTPNTTLSDSNCDSTAPQQESCKEKYAWVPPNLTMDQVSFKYDLYP